MDVKAFTVSEVNNYIKKSLSIDPILSGITVKGEISNLKLHSSGHMYFSLKDNYCRLSCVMFRRDAESLSFIPEEGTGVLAKGSISVYEKSGQYQLYVSEMLKDGLGKLFVAYERLKGKLEKMGYFDESRKKKIPFVPGKIGVVTSAQGAAVRDIISVIKRRFKNVELLVYNALVQGVKAPLEICRGLEYFNTCEKVDVIIVGRGGGSIEELWAFNDEGVARAIYNSTVPVVSAVGHQTDFTIADFVADLRAPTPTAAAQMVVPDMNKVRRNLWTCCRRMEGAVVRQVDLKKHRLDRLKSSYGFRQLEDMIMQRGQQLDICYNRMGRAMTVYRDNRRQLLQEKGARLNSLSPLRILERGYAVVTNRKNGSLLRSVEGVVKGDILDICLQDGNIDVEVRDLHVDGGGRETHEG